MTLLYSKDAQVTTWEMAAFQSGSELYKKICNTESRFTVKTHTPVTSLRHAIDEYILSRLYLETNPSKTTIDSHKYYWIALTQNAIAMSKQHLDINILLTNVVTTIIKKQRDYGHNNIAKFGITGLVIRVHDKVARAENLLLKDNYLNAVENESFYDTLTDIVGYSIISFMWLNNTFLYQLERN
jgi:hypothetical protein